MTPQLIPTFSLSPCSSAGTQGAIDNRIEQAMVSANSSKIAFDYMVCTLRSRLTLLCLGYRLSGSQRRQLDLSSVSLGPVNSVIEVRSSVRIWINSGRLRLFHPSNLFSSSVESYPFLKSLLAKSDQYFSSDF